MRLSGRKGWGEEREKAERVNLKWRSGLELDQLESKAPNSLWVLGKKLPWSCDFIMNLYTDTTWSLLSCACLKSVDSTIRHQLVLLIRKSCCFLSALQVAVTKSKHISGERSWFPVWLGSADYIDIEVTNVCVCWHKHANFFSVCSTYLPPREVSRKNEPHKKVICHLYSALCPKTCL